MYIYLFVDRFLLIQFTNNIQLLKNRFSNNIILHVLESNWIYIHICVFYCTTKRIGKKKVKKSSWIYIHICVLYCTTKSIRKKKVNFFFIIINVIFLNLFCLLEMQGSDFFTEEGMPKTPFPNGWKGEKGLYTVGFTRRGLLGTASDAVKIARDIADQWRTIKDNKNICTSHIILQI